MDLQRFSVPGGSDAPKPAIEAVIFDIDGTLAPGDSFSDTLAELSVSATDLVALRASNSVKTLSYTAVRRQLLKVLTSTGQAQRAVFADLFRRRPLRPEAAELVGGLRALGLPVGIISSSMDLYVEMVAAKLDVKDYYSNLQLHFDERGFLSEVNFDFNAAALKQRQLVAFCQRHEVDPSRVAVIGDGENDLAMFRATGRGILLMNADNRDLVRHAWHAVCSLDAAGVLLRSHLDFTTDDGTKWLP